MKVLIRNHAYNIIAKAARATAYQKQNTHPVESPSISKYVEQKEQSALIFRAVYKLPEQQKRVYLLNKFDGFRPAEIAEAMGLSIHTVKNHLKAASASVLSYCQRNMELFLLILFL
ncbi:RNA polymerase sigma factor [Niabella ginsengisoli]|uniref:Sigma-70 family RNA polymerase sigma factor n=1 Tax=Niabella ginsengisoli TaxID=522298 RepID=A0ABS9SEW1_9BACT|nr:sigma-70 family RNA polymerase sigma factor [Niabella ginsengisoli]MCH5596875.1 sigma-70 family RNA polymerase sigma factor [Niabella ginsengisoli]